MKARGSPTYAREFTANELETYIDDIADTVRVEVGSKYFYTDSLVLQQYATNLLSNNASSRKGQTPFFDYYRSCV